MLVPDETGGWKAPAPLENRSGDIPVADCMINITQIYSV